MEQHMETANLTACYDEIKQKATTLAGGLDDIPQRAKMLHALYVESGENHAFANIAAHGALWAYGYFETGGKLGRIVAKRYFYNSQEQAYRLSLLQRFADDFRRVNRQVFIDTYTNYHFTEQHGESIGADAIVAAPLLEALNRIHQARRNGRPLNSVEKRSAFEQCFRIEQEVTVAPGVREALDSFDCRILKALCMHPSVRFAYFAGGERMFFKDFGNREERIEKGLRAYAIAERVGWPYVTETLANYRV